MHSSPRSYKTVSEYRSVRPAGLGSRVAEPHDDVLPRSIEAALHHFDAEAVSVAGHNPRSSAGIAQFMSREMKPACQVISAKVAASSAGVPGKPIRRALISGKGPIGRNDFGQVVSVRFSGGDTAEFKYNAEGALSIFTYAGLVWVCEKGYWRSGDLQSDYRIDGDVEVLHDGSLRIVKADVARTLRPTGVRIDEHRDGSRTESRKLRNVSTPFDLLAKSKPVSSLWLSSQTQSDSQRIESVQLLEADRSESAPAVNASESYSGKRSSDRLVSSSSSPSSSLASASAGSFTAENVNEARALEGGRSRSSSELSSESQLRAAAASVTTMRNSAVYRLPNLPQRQTFAQRLACLKRDARERVLSTALWLNDCFGAAASPRQAKILDGLAEIYGQKQQNEDAETMHLRALQIKENYYGRHQAELAVNVSGLAEIYLRRCNFARAEQMYKEAVGLYEKGVRKQLFLFSQGISERDNLASEMEALFRSIAALAQTYEAQRKGAATRDLYETAMALWTEISGRVDHGLDSVLQLIIERYIAVMRVEPSLGATTAVLSVKGDS